jgi:hypothetical protein
MGLGNWLARKGNVGGVARAVAIGWKFFKAQDPEMSDKELAEAYVHFRYSNTGEMELADRALSLLEKHKPTPLNLAWVLLLNENPQEIDYIAEKKYSEWRQIIREEIEKMEVTPE